MNQVINAINRPVVKAVRRCTSVCSRVRLLVSNDYAEYREELLDEDDIIEGHGGPLRAAIEDDFGGDFDTTLIEYLNDYVEDFLDERAGDILEDVERALAKRFVYPVLYELTQESIQWGE